MIERLRRRDLPIDTVQLARYLIELMEERREAPALRDLARGPGRLAVAMAIDVRCDGVDLCTDPSLWLGVSDPDRAVVSATTRIGLSRERRRRLRFYERASTFVSGPLRSIRG